MTEQLVKPRASLYNGSSLKNIRYPIVMSEYDRVWQRYCGFLDINVQQFMSIQESLLLQQIDQMKNSALGKKLMCDRVPASVEEFRRVVPLTEYMDYVPELNPANESALPGKPCVWASTSGEAGGSRLVPYTPEAYNRALDNLMAVFILACCRQRGQSSLVEGDRVLYNVAPPPYLSGVLADGAAQVFNLISVMPPDLHDDLDFREKITRGFEMSLRTGVDIIIAMTSVLVKTGSEFDHLSHRKGLSRHLVHPGELLRLSRAYLRSRLDNRRVLPKDVWPVKALIGWGIDTSVYRDLVYKYWGAYPYEFHACTEAGIMAVQSWTRQGLTFIPHANFYEFIPESEWLKSRNDIMYEPRTVLLPEVKPGERYELVISSFYGMPFLRYRLGHLVRITAYEDAAAEIHLPQMVFEARADSLIDIAGFTRISEKTITQAIANTGIICEGWTVRKEIVERKPLLHIYVEFISDSPVEDFASVLHTELMKVDPGYHDLTVMMDIQPLQITQLPKGTFNRYYSKKEQAGLPLANLCPPKVNAADDIIDALIKSSDEAATVNR
jgi:hypothetical protein